MNYIITEEQKNRLEDTITEYLDRHLTPAKGWLSHKEYKKELVEQSGEVFLFFVQTDIPDANEDAHMWYSMCNNGNLSEPLPKGECPLVAIYSPKYEALEGFFGDIWKPTFMKWFKENTGLPVKHVDVQGW